MSLSFLLFRQSPKYLGKHSKDVKKGRRSLRQSCLQHIFTFHENGKGSSAGCLLCKPTAHSSKILKTAVSRASFLLGACSGQTWHAPVTSMGIQQPGRPRPLGCPTGLSISSQAQRQVSKARKRNTTRRCQKNDMMGAAQCLPAFCSGYRMFCGSQWQGRWHVHNRV